MKHTHSPKKYTNNLEYNSEDPIIEEYRAFEYSDYGTVTVNNLGTDIISKTGHHPTIYENDGGYLGVNLNTRKGKQHFLLIHRAVALAFLSNPDNLSEVNHKDLNKKNNCITNLEWVSSKQNTEHSIKHGISHARPGEQNGSAKLTWEDVQYIRNNYKKGNGSQLAKKFRVTNTTINAIIKNKNWKKRR